MNPLFAAAWVGVSLFTSLGANKNQAKLEQAQSMMQMEQQRLQVAEKAYERSKTFKQSTAMNLALSGMGFGGSTGFSATQGESFQNYIMDRNALANADKFSVMQHQFNVSASKVKKGANDVNSFLSAAGLAKDLGLFGK